MLLSVPHNWQSDLLESIDTSLIEDFYGKLETDFLGGGRSSNISVPVSSSSLAAQIKHLHDRGFKFNYLLNASCLDNRELSPALKRKLSSMLEWLRKMNVERVTVTLPYIAMFIKREFPDFKICVSTMAQVDTREKARFWEDLGAYKITLYEVTVNRDFELIKKLRNSVKCRLQLIANNGCLYDCPFTVNHGLLCSHASQRGHYLSGFVIDFYRIFCSYMRITEPANFIRADWIRPEDVHHYEALGIDNLKLVNRGMSTQALSRIVSAYSRAKYDGNLLDLLPSASKNITVKRNKAAYLFKFFFRPRLVNVLKLVKAKKALSSVLENDIFIDNSALDGVLLELQSKGCVNGSCDSCGWCAEVAKKAIRAERGRLEELLKSNGWLVDQFVSGKLFRYF